MSHALILRPARPEEAAALTDLAMRSKAHWGYSEAFLAACRSELTVDATRLGDGRAECVVALEEGAIVGYYALDAVSPTVFELAALFVEPSRIGRGIGRRLLRHALDTVRGAGAARLIIQGDPHATGFYLALGARQIGTRESDSVPGRLLPLFEVDAQARA